MRTWQITATAVVVTRLALGRALAYDTSPDGRAAAASKKNVRVPAPIPADGGKTSSRDVFFKQIRAMLLGLTFALGAALLIGGPLRAEEPGEKPIASDFGMLAPKDAGIALAPAAAKSRFETRRADNAVAAAFALPKRAILDADQQIAYNKLTIENEAALRHAIDDLARARTNTERTRAANALRDVRAQIRKDIQDIVATSRHRKIGPKSSSVASAGSAPNDDGSQPAGPELPFTSPVSSSYSGSNDYPSYPDPYGIPYGGYPVPYAGSKGSLGGQWFQFGSIPGGRQSYANPKPWNYRTLSYGYSSPYGTFLMPPWLNVYSPPAATRGK